MFFIYNRNKKHKIYISYLKDIGLPINILNEMKFNELEDSYEYLTKYKSNLTEASNKLLYNSIKKIQAKYKIFKL